MHSVSLALTQFYILCSSFLAEKYLPGLECWYQCDQKVTARLPWISATLGTLRSPAHLGSRPRASSKLRFIKMILGGNEIVLRWDESPSPLESNCSKISVSTSFTKCLFSLKRTGLGSVFSRFPGSVAGFHEWPRGYRCKVSESSSSRESSSWTIRSLKEIMVKLTVPVMTATMTQPL